jgi:low temperature requirement protein LtrA
VNFSEKIINHHQVSKGFVLMYSHIALVVAILMTTVATLYLNSKAIKLTL